MIRRIHATCGVLAFVTVLVFWSTTAVAELLGSHDAIARVKVAIAFGMAWLVPLVVATALTGRALARRRRGALVERKLARMPIIALNGVLVLLPSALALQHLAVHARFDGTFVAIQLLELTAGAINLALLGASLRDGLRLTGRLRRRARG